MTYRVPKLDLSSGSKFERHLDLSFTCKHCLISVLYIVRLLKKLLVLVKDHKFDVSVNQTYHTIVNDIE